MTMHSRPMEFASVPVTLTYDAQDFLDGLRLNSRMGVAGYTGLAAFLALMFGVFCFFEPDPAARIVVPAAGLIGGGLTRLGFERIVRPILVRRHFAGYPLAHGERSFSLEPDGLRVVAANGSTWLAWRDLIGWRDDRKVTILYIAPRTFVVAPARLAELGFPYEEMKASLAAHVKRR